MSLIKVFTDGSSRNNNKKETDRIGGIGVYFPDNEVLKSISERITPENAPGGKVSNQVTELLACLRALEEIVKLPDPDTYDIEIFSDSKYLINSMESWAANWKQNGWHRRQGKKLVPISNREIMEPLYELYTLLNVRFTYVPGHLPDPSPEDPRYPIWYGNYMADKLATEASS